MSIKKLSYGETYYLSKADGYRREVVDWCWEVYGCSPTDCFGQRVGRGRGKKGKRKYRGQREKSVEIAEWI